MWHSVIYWTCSGLHMDGFLYRPESMLQPWHVLQQVLLDVRHMRLQHRQVASGFWDLQGTAYKWQNSSRQNIKVFKVTGHQEKKLRFMVSLQDRGYKKIKQVHRHYKRGFIKEKFQLQIKWRYLIKYLKNNANNTYKQFVEFQSVICLVILCYRCILNCTL